MNRTASASEGKRRSHRDQQQDADRPGGRSNDDRGPVAALHAVAGNQAVQSVARSEQVRRSPDDEERGAGPRSRPSSTETASASRDASATGSDSDNEASPRERRVTAAGAMCPRCIRRYRAGKPLDCQDCEVALGRASEGQPTRGAVDGDVLQPKLAVSSPSDAAEREAERVADEVMRTPDTPRDRSADAESTDGRGAADSSAGGGTHGGAGERRQRATVRRSVTSASGADGLVDESVESRIRSVRTGGRRLPDSERSFFERRFGTDLSDVRIHTGPTAARTANAIQARAYTVGRDVVFGRGEYRPGSPAGRRLLAHELAHVLQQRGGTEAVSRQLGVEHYPGCTEEVTGVENPKDHLESARQDAIDLVDLAVASLQRTVNGNAGSRVQTALATHFQNPNPRQMRTAISRFRDAKSRLELPNRMICNTAGSSYCRRGWEGYAWPSTGPYIHLCPGAVQDEDDTALTMIHEATHVASGTEDHSYVWQNSYSNLSAAQAVDNADSYAHFAEDVKIEIIRLN